MAAQFREKDTALRDSNQHWTRAFVPESYSYLEIILFFRFIPFVTQYKSRFRIIINVWSRIESLRITVEIIGDNKIWCYILFFSKSQKIRHL